MNPRQAPPPLDNRAEFIDKRLILRHGIPYGESRVVMILSLGHSLLADLMIGLSVVDRRGASSGRGSLWQDTSGPRFTLCLLSSQHHRAIRFPPASKSSSRFKLDSLWLELLLMSDLARAGRITKNSLPSKRSMAGSRPASTPLSARSPRHKTARPSACKDLSLR